MDWAVVATFVGIGVTALLGAFTMAKEQSPIRQLERVSAVLKDLPAESTARAHLEWLQDDLARRLNQGYRAPRYRRTLVVTWIGVLYGYGLAMVMPAWAFVMARPFLADGEVFWWVPCVAALITGAFGYGLARTSMKRMSKRREQREVWIAENDSGASRAPVL